MKRNREDAHCTAMYKMVRSMFVPQNQCQHLVLVSLGFFSIPNCGFCWTDVWFKGLFTEQSFTSKPALSLSLHGVLVRGRVPVWVARHVAVGWHGFWRGRHVPDGRDGGRARGQGHGARDRLTLVRVAALLQQLLKLWPLILEPDLYLEPRRKRENEC